MDNLHQKSRFVVLSLTVMLAVSALGVGVAAQDVSQENGTDVGGDFELDTPSAFLSGDVSAQDPERQNVASPHSVAYGNWFGQAVRVNVLESDGEIVGQTQIVTESGDVLATDTVTFASPDADSEKQTVIQTEFGNLTTTYTLDGDTNQVSYVLSGDE